MREMNREEDLGLFDDRSTIQYYLDLRNIGPILDEGIDAALK